MTREKMLNVLADLPFAMIWPGSWDDIGFTEREIWVNSEGYGYIMCDEPTGRWDGAGITKQEWEILKPKILARSLTYSDIESTSIEDLLLSMGYDECDFEDDSARLSSLLSGLLDLKDAACSYLYALQDYDGLLFFDSESSFMTAFERDWVDQEWDTLDDDLLAEWIDRLSIESDERLIEWTKTHGLPEDECEDGPQDIVETGEYKQWWNTYNTKEFTFCCSTVVYEGKKKRYVTLKATGENIALDKTISPPQTVFYIVSTRKITLGRYVIAGTTDNGDSLSSDEDLGKWAIVKNHMYSQLIDFVIRVTGHNLGSTIKEALNTTALDQLIREAEEKA